MGIMREHQIEELLLQEAKGREVGQDLIEEYFSTQASLDPITKKAKELIQRNPEKQQIICKNLSECIVVKNQIEKTTPMGFTKKILSRVGIHLGKNREILQAENLIKKILSPPSSSRFR